LGNLDLFGRLFPARAPQARECLLGLIEHLLDPGVDLARLDAELVGQVGNRYFVAQVPPHDLGLFLYAEASALLAAHEILLRWALC